MKTNISTGYNLIILLDFFFLEQRKTIPVDLQKDVVFTQSNQAVKKSVALCKMASMKKVVKYRWWPRNGCDGRSVAKILITDEIILPHPSKYKFT